MEFKLDKKLGANAKITEFGLTVGGLNGVKKDERDERDYIFKSKLSAEEQIPSKYDLIEHMGEIENQLQTGSCVANATCSALELMSDIEGDGVDLSRLFVYFNAREPYDELRGKDGGAYLRDGFKSCNQIGVCNESTWDFIESKVNDKPSDLAYSEAPDKKVLKYERIENGDIQGVKLALLAGHPVIFGMYLFEDFFYLRGPLEDMDYLGRNSGSDYVGGHAMTIIGYDDDLNGGSFIVENSWSTQWGDNGIWAMRYDVFEIDVMDLWVCTEFEIDLLKPEPEEPEEKDYEVTDTFDELKKWFHKTFRYVIDLIIEMPSMKEMWEKILEGLRAVWEKFKGAI